MYQQTWKTEKVHMDTNKEIFDAELYTITEALVVAWNGR